MHAPPTSLAPSVFGMNQTPHLCPLAPLDLDLPVTLNSPLCSRSSSPTFPQTSQTHPHLRALTPPLSLGHCPSKGWVPLAGQLKCH